MMMEHTPRITSLLTSCTTPLPLPSASNESLGRGVHWGTGCVIAFCIEYGLVLHSLKRIQEVVAFARRVRGPMQERYDLADGSGVLFFMKSTMKWYVVVGCLFLSNSFIEDNVWTLIPLPCNCLLCLHMVRLDRRRTLDGCRRTTHIDQCPFNTRPSFNGGDGRGGNATSQDG